MKTTTLKQAVKVMEMLKEIPREHIQMLLSSGLFSDFLKANVGEVDREAFQKVCGLRPSWEVWKTIKRNPALNSSDAFLSALEEKDCRVSDWAKNVISKPEFIESLNDSREYELFDLTTAQLTGEKKARSKTEKIFAGIEHLGFQMCPAWMGPQLRLDHKDQPKGKWLCIAMKPILDSDSDPHVFYVKHDDSGFWLDAHRADPGALWGRGCWWVVCRLRK